MSVVPGKRMLVDARPRARPELEVDVDQVNVGVAVRRLRATFFSFSVLGVLRPARTRRFDAFSASCPLLRHPPTWLSAGVVKVTFAGYEVLAGRRIAQRAPDELNASVIADLN